MAHWHAMAQANCVRLTSACMHLVALCVMQHSNHSLLHGSRSYLLAGWAELCMRVPAVQHLLTGGPRAQAWLCSLHPGDVGPSHLPPVPERHHCLQGTQIAAESLLQGPFMSTWTVVVLLALCHLA